AELESEIDVEAFLRWLAVNSALENWDAYGLMAHNYYLYSVEGDDGRFQWIPWDHNLSQANSMMGETDVMLDSVTDAWPLIRRLLDDPVYAAFYEDQLALALEGAYAQEAYEARIDSLAALVQPALFGEEGEQPGFTGLTDEATWVDAIAALKAHGVSRRAEVEEALNP
ncbi:MAG TPA: CotH kinase family protein, partial [Myxococcota bacterium]|nr:CotH kinase family protein [Myxococcota bacterium]